MRRHFTTSVNDAPSASRMAVMLSMVFSVCRSIVSPTIFPVQRIDRSSVPSLLRSTPSKLAQKKL